MIEKKIIEKYSSEFKKYGIDDRRSLLWTKDKQDMRFYLLLDEKLKASKMSLLDYGCGFADLKIYLEKNFYNLNYSGCDINEEFVKISTEKYKEANIYKVDSSKDIEFSYDVILISGTFNVIGLDSIEDMQNYIFQQLSTLFKKTNYMMSVNFLSHLTDAEYKYDGHFYLDPMKLYKYAIENLTKRIQIDTSSMPYEIIFKFYKNEEIDYNMTTYKEV